MNDVKPFRIDAIDKVTGRARYSSDYFLENMLNMKVLWAPAPHAKIVKIDLTKAKEAPGVERIITREDITGPNLTGVFEIFDRPILIGEGEECHFCGDAIALVVANNEDNAERARELIKIEYEEMSFPNSEEQAKSSGVAPCIEKTIEKGDVEKGLEQAKVIVEEEYSIPYVDHAYLEPEGGVAFVEQHGVTTIYAGTQDIVTNQRAMCTALNYPFNKVRLHSPYVGGAFGGKHLLTVQPYLLLAAHVIQRPVKLVFTREESLAFSCKKQKTSGKIKLGLDSDGKIVSLSGHIDGASAYYLANSGDNCYGVLGGMVGPFRIPNVKLTGNMWRTTGPEMGAFRGVGAPDGVLIFESLLVKAGAKLGLTQLEVHKRNWIKSNGELADLATGALIKNTSKEWPIEKLMDIALKEAGEIPKASKGKRIGRGIASAKPAYATRNTDWHSGSTVQFDMYLDGTLNVKVGFPELGQGISGIITKIAAREMGIEEEKVNVILSDSFYVPPAGALGFSQATVCIGNCIVKAAQKMKEGLCQRACAYLNTADSVVFDKYCFYNKHKQKVLEWKEFSDYCFAQVDYLSIKERDRGDMEQRNQYSVTPIVCVADIEVDEETGEIKILQLIHCHDIGKVIHEESARGQIIGGALMSLGGYLMEEFLMKDGHATTPSFAEYLIPTALDIPLKNEVVFYEGNKAQDGPWGAKGLGEHGCYCSAAAVSNALFDAIGEFSLKLPVTPEKVLMAMGKIK